MLLRTMALVAVAICFTSIARAQPAPDRRFIVGVSAGIQVQSSARTDVATFNLNQEVGTLQSTQTLGPYAVFDGGGSMRLWNQLGVSLAVSRAQGQAPTLIEAQVPHPFFFDFDRTATASAEGLTHREIAYHLSAQYQHALGASTLLRLSVGPTFFDASQALVSGIVTVERGFPFEEVDIVAPTVEEVSVTGWGYNVGVDIAYFGLRGLGLFGDFEFLDRVGVGFMARYSRAKPDVTLQGVRQVRALQVGLVHLVGGVRVGF